MNDTLKQFSVYLEQSKSLAEKYGKKTEYDGLSAILEQGAKQELVLLVCGEFKRGKSSFVNALLGQDLCPVADGITTSTVSIIRYGDKAKAVRHYSTLVMNEKNEEELSLQEEEISIDQISRFAKGTSDEIGNTMFIEIETSSVLLKNGLVVIDTPGVGSLDPRHLFLTLQALPKADAFFYVTDTGEPLTTTELGFIKERLVPTGKPFDLLLSKSDKIGRDELSRYIEDTEKKVYEDCGVKVKCTPVSSTEWDSFNKSGNERRRVNSNCGAVYTAINSFRTRREHLFAEKFREQCVIYLEGIKQQATEALEAVNNNSNEEIESLKQRLNELSAFKNIVTNKDSEFRANINCIIETSQEKVMHKFSRDSVLLSSEKLDEILNKPEATKKDGEEFVMKEVNEAINKLSSNLDNQITQAMGEVLSELHQYIKSIKLEGTGFDGAIHDKLDPLVQTISEKFMSVTRSALPFIGVTTIASGVTGIPLYLGASLLGLAVTPFAVVAGAVGLAAGVYYVVQAIKGGEKAARIAYIKKQVIPRITIAMNELRLYVQKRFTMLQKEVVNALSSVAENMTKQMQETVRLMQECQQGNQIKVQKTKEIESDLKLVGTLATQVKVFGTNPFGKK